MQEDELRALVRDAIARHLGQGAENRSDPSRSLVRPHPSHVRLPLLTGSDEDGACLIEPAVRCVHCGYCQSFGH